ncbi:MAG: Crp/Fnr family transcriptional regulator [Deltaproteobacteria bacterium]|nr:Crp/Fnr family transcriptional regulator [Deltaproteobacteria bacterium]
MQDEKIIDCDYFEAQAEQQETIRILAPYLQARHYRADQILWTEGEVSGRLVLLDRGRVKAVRVLPDGSSVLLYVFAAGDLFGFLPFVDGGPYPATAIAVDDVDARVMSRSTLRQAIQADHQVAMVLLGALGKRLRQAFGRLGDQAQRSSVARVAAALCLLLPAGATAAILTVDVPTPIHGFAADVGMTPETFSRAVTGLVEAGVLHRLSSPRLQVLDTRRLWAIASGGDDTKQKTHKTNSD